MKRKRAKNRDRVVGVGYVGRWGDGSIGWGLPNFLSGLAGHVEAPGYFFEEHSISGDRAIRCRITVEVLRDKRGRLVTRKPKGERP